jgi:FMN phosphatase YigB (HAD superfamily)
LDFDHTLFDTDRFFWVDVRAAFRRFGVADDAWEQSYDAVWPSGYSLVKHLDELERLGAVPGPDTRSAMLTAFEASFSDLHAYLFPDVPGFLEAARQREYDLLLLSFGDPAWQQYKVEASGIVPLFRKIVYTAQHRGKADLAEALGAPYISLHVIDNNPADLDAIKARSVRFQTYLICRVEPEAPGAADPAARDRFREAARYLDIPPRLAHRRCRSLAEITL